MKRLLVALLILSACDDETVTTEVRGAPPLQSDPVYQDDVYVIPDEVPSEPFKPPVRTGTIMVPLSEKHLLCKNESGEIVVDTYDVFKKPRVEGASWTWLNKDRSQYTQISVPPLWCLYTSKNVVENPEE